MERGDEADVVIRSLQDGDADGIAAVHITSWRETYAGLVPVEMYDDAALERRRIWWGEVIERAEAGTLRSTTRVAELGGRIVGFATVGPTREGHQERPIELGMLYTLAEVHGRGIGDALLAAVLGDTPAQLWVAEENPRARRFYERHGFRWGGVRKLDEHLDGLAEVLLVR